MIRHMGKGRGTRERSDARPAVSLDPDALRRLATALLAAQGVRPDAASAWATRLLKLDSWGFPDHGIGTLPTWLERLERGDFHPSARGHLVRERAGVGVFDAENGPPDLMLAEAGRLAVEKAREAGVGCLRVERLGSPGALAAHAAELGSGPTVGLIFGPESTWASATPTPEGPPWIFDSILYPAGPDAEERARSWTLPYRRLAGGGWLVMAIVSGSWEPLALADDWDAPVGLIGIDLRDPHGPETLVRLDEPAWQRLREAARRRGLPEPEPFAPET